MVALARAAAVMTVITAATAANAPVVNDSTPNGVTYAATIPASAQGISGAVKGAISPTQIGTAFQVAFYNLPAGNITYGIYTGRVGTTADCSLAGGLLNPFSGFVGAACSPKKPEECAIGDLSDKHGVAHAQGSSASAGTGYFAQTFIDDYLSVYSDSQSFFGHGSLVLMDSTGAPIACADFVNPNQQVATTSATTASMAASSSAPAKTKQTKPTKKVGASSVAASATASRTAAGPSSTSSGSAAMRTAAVGLMGGMMGLGALIL